MKPIEQYSEYNGLEKHLHENLHQYAPEAPEHLWSGIEAQLPRQRRRPVLWWWLSMTVVFFTIDYRFDPVHKSNTLSSAVPLVIEPNLRKYPVTVNLPDRFPGKDAARELADYQNTGAEQTSVATSGTVPGIPPLTVNILSAEQLQTDNDPLDLSGSPSFGTLPVKEIAGLHSATPGFPLINFPVKSARTRHWTVEMGAAPVWIWQPATGAEMHHGGQSTFAEHQQGPAFGWQKGFTLGYRLGARWQVNAGLNRRQMTQLSSHTATLRLMDGICLNAYDPGPKEYEFEYALQSGNEQSNVTVRIAQVDSVSAMPADEPFMLDMRTLRRSTNWVLPLTIRCYFGQGRWQGFVQVGGQFNLPAQTIIQVDHFNEACMDLCFATGRIPRLELVERGQTALAWQLGAGFGYALTPRWGISVDPAFFGRKGQSGVSLNAGLQYKF